ncbi:MAG: hypothetical protein HOV80_39410 [Polyangiaceae bacterium]|nr:hypothetical protein [Polyangiaceae bacterium]
MFRDFAIVLLPGEPRTRRQIEAARQWLDTALPEGTARVVFVPDRAELGSNAELSRAFGASFCAKAVTTSVVQRDGKRVFVATHRRLRSHQRSWPAAPILALWPTLDDLRLIAHRAKPTALAIAAADLATVGSWLTMHGSPGEKLK